MAVAGDPFLAPRCNPDLILAAIRQQLFHHRGAGRQNVVAFKEAFTAWDGDGDHRLSHFEFEKALGRCGIFLPAQEVNVLFRRFDTLGDGHADAEQALSALRLPLNERRLAVVDVAFLSVATGVAAAAAAAAADRFSANDKVASATAGLDGKGFGGEGAPLPLSEVLGRMNPEVHPEVATGRLDAQQIKDDFCDFFANRAGRTGDGERKVSDNNNNNNNNNDDDNTSTPTVTLEGFREYYRDVGVCEPYDTVFIPMIEALWGVEEPRPAEADPSGLTQLLLPKLLQHSHNAETPAEVFRKSLRYFSLDSGGEDTKHGGFVDASGLERALKVFGLYPDRKEIEDILIAVGSPPGEPGQVDKVVSFLCPPEAPMAPMF